MLVAEIFSGSRPTSAKRLKASGFLPYNFCFNTGHLVAKIPMKKKIDLLIPHPQNKLLYGDAEEPDQVANLADNIKKYGQITPVVINPSNLILSGHRRISALKVLGRTYAECVIRDVEPDAEIYYLIAANKQRQKDMVQLSNEIELLYSLYSKGQGHRSDLTEDGTSDPKTQRLNTREAVAADLAVSNKTISDLRFIKKHRPDVIPHIGPVITLSSAATQVRIFANQERLIEDKVKPNGHLSKGKRFKIYCQSSKTMSQLSAEVDVAMFSPPYFNLRTFSGSKAEIGGEKDLEDYIDNLIEICAEVKRVLKPTGSIFINLADTYRDRTRLQVPERVGIRLTDDLGFSLRNHLCWDKGNSYTPDSTDRRRHSAWESVFWLVKDPKEYFFDDNDARVPYETALVIDARSPRHHNDDMTTSKGGMSLRHPKGKLPSDIIRVARSGPSQKIRGEAKHSAPYPIALCRDLLKGVVEDDYLVLDPFCGQGTTGLAAAERNCRFIGYDISQSFCRLARRRLSEVY